MGNRPAAITVLVEPVHARPPHLRLEMHRFPYQYPTAFRAMYFCFEVSGNYLEVLAHGLSVPHLLLNLHFIDHAPVILRRKLDVLIPIHHRSHLPTTPFLIRRLVCTRFLALYDGYSLG